jgi:hypothetical protein
MGSRLEKTNIRFVMETSSCGKTDTFVQSLLGRVCGYNSRPDIKVYIKNLDEAELRKFIALHEGDFKSLPSNAMNMIKTTKTRSPIKPIRITLDENPSACLAINVLQELDHLHHQNTPEDMEIILPIIRDIANAFAKLSHVRSDAEKNMAIHWKQHKSGAIYEVAMPKIEQAWRNGDAQCEFGEGAGVCATENEVVVWQKNRHLYITMQIEKGIVSVTTKREVFCSEIVQGATFLVPSSTRIDTMELERVLDALIEASRELGSPKITSNGNGEYILFNQIVFDYLQTIILPKWESQGVIIKTRKVGGRKPAGLIDIRLAEITWNKPVRL